ncbi:hypothetical protein Vi05172_g6593 [Venturia inaequalis]|nr:hypothetical protein Vi05172_g6593 [Venturia inaequalis]
MVEKQQEMLAQHQATLAEGGIVVGPAITPSRNGDESDGSDSDQLFVKSRPTADFDASGNSVYEPPTTTEKTLPDVQPGAFPKFNKLPVELRMKIFRHHLRSSPPLAIYQGPQLSKLEGPQPFSGPNAIHLALFSAQDICRDTIRMMNEPDVIQHVIHIDSENINQLQHWLASAPITTFKNVALRVRLTENPSGSSAPLHLLQSTHNSIAQFTSAKTFELFFEMNFLGCSEADYFGKSAREALYYDFKKTMKALPRLQHIEISHGPSYERCASTTICWEKKREGCWLLCANDNGYNDLRQSDHKDREMRVFTAEMRAFRAEEHYRELVGFRDEWQKAHPDARPPSVDQLYQFFWHGSRDSSVGRWLRHSGASKLGWLKLGMMNELYRSN